MLQGAFVKRHNFKKADGSQLEFKDICVGGNLELYGKQIHITDADAATRSFMEQQSMPQPSAESYPAGPYDQIAASRVHSTGNDIIPLTIPGSHANRSGNQTCLLLKSADQEWVDMLTTWV